MLTHLSIYFIKYIFYFWYCTAHFLWVQCIQPCDPRTLKSILIEVWNYQLRDRIKYCLLLIHVPYWRSTSLGGAHKILETHSIPHKNTKYKYGIYISRLKCWHKLKSLTHSEFPKLLLLQWLKFQSSILSNPKCRT